MHTIMLNNFKCIIQGHMTNVYSRLGFHSLKIPLCLIEVNTQETTPFFFPSLPFNFSGSDLMKKQVKQLNLNKLIQHMQFCMWLL